MKLLIILVTLLFVSTVNALTIKTAVVVPEGTTWAKQLKKMAKEIKKQTDGKVKIKIYFGGSQGDEPDVLRKIRVGQLHAGVFTGKTLGEINGDVRVMEIPFNFLRNRDKAFKTLEKMEPFFNVGFEKNEFHNLGFFEMGLVYFVSQKEATTLDSMKGMKIWSWEGDEVVSTMIEELKLVSVPLPLPDVLSSLSTGIVEAAYAPAMGMVALQWNTKIKYLLDFPLAYSIGAFLINSKVWKKLTPAQQKILDNIGSTYIKKISKGNDKENKEALAAMKTMGVKFLEFSKKDVAKSKKIRGQVVNRLKGKLFSEAAYKKLEKEL
jgi:TRAP-type C4-dicarboxylate transport system substrate-binding protein